MPLDPGTATYTIVDTNDVLFNSDIDGQADGLSGITINIESPAIGHTGSINGTNGLDSFIVDANNVNISSASFYNNLDGSFSFFVDRCSKEYC
ncbi:hypothetical protein LNTAR_13167 [Lentisphaera araneosa HTCC2155]|uniref:Uncharacterized protein n=1 Tax=Lentisphaera araneosa HTCC2155 TaxID=313628 RepID=A6DRN2_9BACT|nr:hypothetical protein [Lentisphaera araneosa]EDM25701.1 hypothetical protein LNTAR_13167 [Lentisphaera araneosa HTCC2155]